MVRQSACIPQDIIYAWALAETYTADADVQQEMRWAISPALHSTPPTARSHAWDSTPKGHGRYLLF